MRRPWTRSDVFRDRARELFALLASSRKELGERLDRARGRDPKRRAGEQKLRRMDDDGMVPPEFELHEILGWLGVMNFAEVARWMRGEIAVRPEIVTGSDPIPPGPAAREPIPLATSSNEDLDNVMANLARLANETAIEGWGIELPRPVVEKVQSLVKAVMSASDLYNQRRKLSALLVFLMTLVPVRDAESASVQFANPSFPGSNPGAAFEYLIALIRKALSVPTALVGQERAPSTPEVAHGVVATREWAA